MGILLVDLSSTVGVVITASLISNPFCVEWFVAESFGRGQKSVVLSAAQRRILDDSQISSQSSLS
jgi:hypothetical protein